MNRRAEKTDPRLEQLWRDRPRSRFVRWSLLILVLGGTLSWLSRDFDIGAAFDQHRRANLANFLKKVRPEPLRGETWDTGVAVRWAGELLDAKGWQAAKTTLAISILAIVLAASASFLLSLAAARNLASPEPYLPSGIPPSRLRAFAWKTQVALVRALLIVLRAMPEYIWAFLLLGLLEPTAWPLVLALALHNAGILGRLNAEVVENADAAPSFALRALGARRRQLAASSLFPAVLPRFLLYFFYRWETCVREATVLGLLGIASLGFWISDARARERYDDFVFLILLGASMVLLGDLVSAVARRLVRHAS